MEERTLKSWYINFDKINTSNITYRKYLLSKSRHPGQSIVELSKSDNVIKLDTDQTFYREDIQAKKKERKATNGREVVISLPEDITSSWTNEDWKKLYMDCFKDLYSKILEDNYQELKIDKEFINNMVISLTSKIYAVKHKNNHIHCIVPTLYYNGENNSCVFNRFISKKRYSQFMKKRVDKWMQDNKNISKNDYVINKNRNNLYQIDKTKRKTTLENYEEYYQKLEQKEQELDQKEKNLLEREKVVNERYEEVKKIRENKEELLEINREVSNTIQLLKNEIINLENQFEKMLEHSLLTQKEEEKIKKQIETAKKQVENSNTQRAGKTITRTHTMLDKLSNPQNSNKGPNPFN